ncbi:hypothetical protein OG21DRAFT_123003 [Imleria badia]|nr:hypothetical protein OG21DRAFT_123003 [Imleria badia]
MQILLALQHCHHPPNPRYDLDGKRRQMLRRDLKPDNSTCPARPYDLAHASPAVFLSLAPRHQLGDFGLSKRFRRRALPIFMSGYVSSSSFPCSNFNTTSRHHTKCSQN